MVFVREGSATATRIPTSYIRAKTAQSPRALPPILTITRFRVHACLRAQRGSMSTFNLNHACPARAYANSVVISQLSVRLASRLPRTRSTTTQQPTPAWVNAPATRTCRPTRASCATPLPQGVRLAVDPRLSALHASTQPIT